MSRLPDREIYGILVEFAEPETLTRAAEMAYSAGFRFLDAFSPFPVEGVAEKIGFKHDAVALVTLLGGIGGGVGAFVMQWVANTIDYPINIGGRPDFSWPSFIPITFELTVLGAALSAAVGMLVLNRLPQPWHPVFNSERFFRASRDRFFLCIQAKDPRFDRVSIQNLFQDLHPLSLEEVEIGGET